MQAAKFWSTAWYVAIGTPLLLFALFLTGILHGGEISYADAYAKADREPMVAVYTTAWCPKCHPYVDRLLVGGINLVHVQHSTAFPLAPHTEIWCRSGDEWVGYDFNGAVPTEQVKAAVQGCRDWLVQQRKAKP